MTGVQTCALPISAGQIGNAMVGAAARSVVSQGINIVTGQQKSFNWASVAVSAVSAPLSQSLSGRVEGSGPWASLARSGIGALTSAGTRAAIMGGGFSWEGVAGDALSGFVRMDGFGNASGNSIGDNSTAVGAANSDSDLNAILDGVPDLLRGERIVLVDAGGRTSDVSKGVIGSDRVQLGTTDIDVFRINDGAEALQGKFPDFPATAGQWRAAVAANMDRLDLLGEANGEAFIRDVKRRNNEVPDFMRSGEPEDGYANVSADGFQYDASQPRQALSGFDLNRRWQTLDQIFVGAQEYYAEQGALAGQENRPIGFVGNGIGFALTGVGSVLTPRTGFEATMAVVAGPYVEAALPMVSPHLSMVVC